MQKIIIKKIIKTNRKTIKLEVTHDKMIVIKIPYYFPLNDLDKIIESQKKWILKSIKKIKTYNFKKGEKFLFMGKSYTLKIVSNISEDLILKEHFYLNKSKIKNARNIFENFYKRKAMNYFSKRLHTLANKNNIKFRNFYLSNARKRWGSCNIKNDIRISWRLIQAPKFVIDYVLMHELVHVLEKNHSANFWSKLESYYPDYKKAKKWLKNNSHILNFL